LTWPSLLWCELALLYYRQPTEGIQKSFESGSKRMAKIEYLLYAVIAAVLLGPGVAAEFVKKLLGL